MLRLDSPCAFQLRLESIAAANRLIRDRAGQRNRLQGCAAATAAHRAGAARTVPGVVPGPDWQRLVDVTPQPEFLLAVVGLAGVTHPADYICGAAGNAALDALAKSAGKHSIQHGVRVLAVHPGPALTDRMITRGKAAARKRYGDEGRWQELQGAARGASRSGGPCALTPRVGYSKAPWVRRGAPKMEGRKDDPWRVRRHSRRLPCFAQESSFPSSAGGARLLQLIRAAAHAMDHSRAAGAGVRERARNSGPQRQTNSTARTT